MYMFECTRIISLGFFSLIIIFLFPNYGTVIQDQTSENIIHNKTGSYCLKYSPSSNNILNILINDNNSELNINDTVWIWGHNIVQLQPDNKVNIIFNAKNIYHHKNLCQYHIFQRYMSDIFFIILSTVNLIPFVMLVISLLCIKLE